MFVNKLGNGRKDIKIARIIVIIIYIAPAFLLNDNTTTDVNMGSPAAAGSGGETDTISPETHMVVMPNDEDRKPCPICGERFIDFWNDDEEEWMYKNAVMVDNTVS